MRKIILFVAVILTSISCTQNARARKFGGTEIINLEKGKKLENITWKGEQLWILETNMTPDDKPRELKFKEKSSYGLIEGTIIIKENK